MHMYINIYTQKEDRFVELRLEVGAGVAGSGTKRVGCVSPHLHTYTHTHSQTHTHIHTCTHTHTHTHTQTKHITHAT